jgi:hypothetical protein
MVIFITKGKKILVLRGVREGRGEDKTVDKMRFWGLIILFTSI